MYSNEVIQQEKKPVWRFGTKEVVYAAIGAALYAVVTWAFNVWQIPGAGNVGIRPAVVIPMFFGIAFGPIVGLITGFVGNILADLLSGYGFWIWWDLGNGIMGLIPGLFSVLIPISKVGARYCWLKSRWFGCAVGNGGGCHLGDVGVRRGHEHCHLCKLPAGLHYQCPLGLGVVTIVDGRVLRDCHTKRSLISFYESRRSVSRLDHKRLCLSPGIIATETV